MSELKNIFTDRVTSPAITNNAVTQTVGVVLKANEKENVCDVGYINSAGKYQRKRNVEYEVKNKKDDWFPEVRDKIVLKESNDNQPVIIGALLDYTKDIRPNRRYKKDVMPKNYGAVRGQLVE